MASIRHVFGSCYPVANFHHEKVEITQLSMYISDVKSERLFRSSSLNFVPFVSEMMVERVRK